MIDPALRQQMAALSAGELAAMASSPMNVMEKMAALAELGQRMKAEQIQPPNSTVLQDIVQQQQQPRSAGAPVNPVANGAAVLMQQQAQPQPPARMAMGGPVYRGVPDIGNARTMLGPNMAGALDLPQEAPPTPSRRRGGSRGMDHFSYMESILPRLQALYASGAEGYPENPEAALALASQFYGPDRLAPFLAELEGQKGEARRGRKRDRGLAIAQAGFKMMGSPTFFSGLGRGGMTLAEGLTEADDRYNRATAENFRSRLGIAGAQSDRDRSIGGSASGLFTGGIDARSRMRDRAASTALALTGEKAQDARTYAGIAADQNKLRNQFNALVEMGHSPEEAREIISRAVGGSSGTRANNYDDIIRLGQLLLTDNQARRLYDDNNGEGAAEKVIAAMQRIVQSEVGGGIASPTPPGAPAPVAPAAPSTERPTNTRASTERPTTTRASGSQAPTPRPTTIPTRTRDGVVIDYGGRPPARRQEEKYGYTREPG